MKRALFLLCVLPFFASAQHSGLGAWWMYYGNQQLNTQWNWNHGIQYRNYNAAGDLELLYIHAGLGYNLSANNNNLLFGYAYLHGENYRLGSEGKVALDQHWIYQQLTHRQGIGRVGLRHRFRLEERFVADDLRLCFRYLVAAKIPLNHPSLVEHTVYFSCYNEIFLNAAKPLFNRNRLYGGLGYRLRKGLSIELAYMNQFFAKGGRDQLNVYVSTSF